MELKNPSNKRRLRQGTRWSALVAAGILGALTMWPAGAQEPSTWTVNGDEMPLKEFIAQVQEIIGKTIVVDQRSRQSNQVVTVLSNVPLEADGVYKLFLAVLKVHDLVAVEHDGIISIVQNVRAKTEGGALKLITSVVPLDHVPGVRGAQGAEAPGAADWSRGGDREAERSDTRRLRKQPRAAHGRP